MTKKDFELIADALRRERDYFDEGMSEDPLNVIDQVAYRLRNSLAETNPRFDGERFLKACGVGA